MTLSKPVDLLDLLNISKMRGLDLSHLFGLFLLKNSSVDFSFFYLFVFNEVQLIYNVVQSLPYSKVTQLYTYILFFIFFSIMVYHRILNMVPCAMPYDLVVYPSYI